MGWLEVLKELLKLFPQLIRDLPVWAKVGLTFGILLLVAVLAIASLKLLIVYDIEVLEKPSTAVASGGPYNIHYENTETKTDENGRAKLVSLTSILDRQENRIVIKKPAVNFGENPLRAPYAFASKFWQSQMASFTLTCDFEKGACEREKTGQFQDIQERPKGTASRQGPIVSQAYAQAREASPASSPKELVAPTIQTLMKVAPDGGYTEVRFTKLTLAPGFCKKIGRCSDTLIADVEWNGIRLLFDGIEPWVSRERNLAVIEEGQVRGELLFGIENTLFGEGLNSLKVSIYSRGDPSAIRQSPAQQGKPQLALVDVLQTSLVLFRSGVVTINGQSGALTASVETRTFRDRLGRSYEVFAGSGSYVQVTRKRDHVNTQLSLSFDGQPVVSMLRPPLPGKDAWGLAIGIRDPTTGRVRILFSEDEARRLRASLRELPASRLGPLSPDEFFTYKLRDVQ